MPQPYSLPHSSNRAYKSLPPARSLDTAHHDPLYISFVPHSHLLYMLVTCLLAQICNILGVSLRAASTCSQATSLNWCAFKSLSLIKIRLVSCVCTQSLITSAIMEETLVFPTNTATFSSGNMPWQMTFLIMPSHTHTVDMDLTFQTLVKSPPGGYSQWQWQTVARLEGKCRTLGNNQFYTHDNLHGDQGLIVDV